MFVVPQPLPGDFMPTRRQVLKTLAVATFASSAFAKFSPAMAADVPAAGQSGPYTLPPLPYGYDALEPSIDAETMHLHHDKHHAGYVKKLNEALAKEPSFKPPANVDDLVAHLDQVPESIRTAVRNQGGGHANHSLFWLTLESTIQETIDGEKESARFKTPFNEAVTSDLGGLDKLKASMSEEGGKVFGSGWVWLVLDGGKKLTVMTTANQDSPLTEGHYPLFGLDVWEHAYYLKYHNVRADYLAAIWNVINWDFISGRYAQAMKA
jgi:Fe-Mn family superoxide dismutase